VIQLSLDLRQPDATDMSGPEADDLKREKKRANDRKRYAENLERERARSRKRYADNLEKERARWRETKRRYRAVNNRKKELAAARLRRAKNREHHRASERARARANRGIQRAKDIRRRFREEKRTPVWVDMNELNEFYRNCPEGMTVDHIVPLMGKTVEGYRVNGLHLPWNLDYLTHIENSRKCNRMRPEDHAIADGPPSERPPPRPAAASDPGTAWPEPSGDTAASGPN